MLPPFCRIRFRSNNGVGRIVLQSAILEQTMSQIRTDSNLSPSRRGFLRTSAAVAAATTLPAWFVEECEASQQPAKEKLDTPGIALVGCGGRGRGDANDAARYGRIV